MKNHFVLWLILVVQGMTVSAQETNSLFKDVKPQVKNWSLELQASGQYGRLDQSDALYGLVKAGLAFNPKWSAGLWGNMSVNNIRPVSEPTANTYLDYRAAGLYTRFSPWANKTFHLSFPLSLGGGEIELDGDEGDIEAGEAYFALIEPGVLLEVNLFPNLALHTGATYRLSSDVSYRNLPTGSLNGVQAQLGLRWKYSKKK